MVLDIFAIIIIGIGLTVIVCGIFYLAKKEPIALVLIGIVAIFGTLFGWALNRIFP